jgi:hypothetical protein
MLSGEKNVLPLHKTKPGSRNQLLQAEACIWDVRGALLNIESASGTIAVFFLKLPPEQVYTLYTR